MPSPYKKSFAAEQLKLQKKSQKNLWIFLAVAGLAVVVGGYALYLRFSVTEEPVPVEERITSIAVLPFVNMSADPEQEYFCDGISEEILNALTHVKSLHVPARTSSFIFKDQQKDVREIGEILNVEAVLEGSVRKADSRIRITTQLSKVSDGYHLWSETYDRELKDIFTIQEDIANEVVNALKITLLGEEKTAIAKHHTEDIDAYDLYLLGRSHLYKRTREDYLTALEYFEKAIENDQNFALAYTGKADTYFYGYAFSDSLSIKESWQRGKEAAQTALNLDDNLAEAHNSFARFTLYLNWDWETARRHFERALELNPNYALAYWHYHDYLWAMGRADEAILEMKKAQELDPLAVHLYNLTGWNYSMLGRYDEATEQYNKAFEIDPDNGETFWRLTQHYYYQKNYTKAIDAYIKSLKLSGRSPETSGWLGNLYALAGERDKAERILEAMKEQTPVPLFPMAYINISLGETDKAEQLINEIIERKKDENIASFWIAQLYLYSGNKDKAFEWLNKAVEYRDGGISEETTIKLDPDWAHVRSDPRFKAVLKKMGLE